MLGMDGRESLLGWPRSLLSLAHPGGKTRRRFLNREFSHISVVGRGFRKLTGSGSAAPSHPKIPVPTAGWQLLIPWKIHLHPNDSGKEGLGKIILPWNRRREFIPESWNGLGGVSIPGNVPERSGGGT